MERVHKDVNVVEQPTDDLEINDYIDASCDLCSEKTFISFNAVHSHYLEVHGTKDGYVKCCKSKKLFGASVWSSAIHIIIVFKITYE